MSDRQRDDRALGPEMIAERWQVTGGDWIAWLHQPSMRSVTVEGPFPRKGPRCDTTTLPAIPEEPTDPLTEGYLVACRRHDEFGNPTAGEGFWVASYGDAIRIARRIRTSILGAPPSTATQLTFDDLVKGEPA